MPRPTGSGKTNFLHHLIAGDILRGQSIVVLDARGDLALATIELAARAGVEPGMVKFLNLREKERPLGFNPLAGAGEPYYRALGLLDAVAAESESWGVQLAETFRNALLLLAETGHPITQLEALLLVQKVADGIVPDDVAREQFEDFGKRLRQVEARSGAIYAAGVR